MPLISFAPRPFSARRGKILIWLLGFLALGLFACCGSVGFFAIQSQKKKQEALVEADTLYPSKPTDAVVKYKEAYDAAGARKAEVLQRIVDHEADGMNNAEAMKWIARGIDEKILPEYKSTLARVWYAKAQQDRADKEAAKKADEDAKRAARDAKAKERDDRNRKYTRDEFKQLIVGKTRDEVIALLGKPKTTQQVGGVDYWEYPSRTTDPVTEKTDHNAQVVFDGDRASDVTFVRF